MKSESCLIWSWHQKIEFQLFWNDSHVSRFVCLHFWPFFKTFSPLSRINKIPIFLFLFHSLSLSLSVCPRISCQFDSTQDVWSNVIFVSFFLLLLLSDLSHHFRQTKFKMVCFKTDISFADFDILDPPTKFLLPSFENQKCETRLIRKHRKHRTLTPVCQQNTVQKKIWTKTQDFHCHPPPLVLSLESGSQVFVFFSIFQCEDLLMNLNELWWIERGERSEIEGGRGVGKGYSRILRFLSSFLSLFLSSGCVFGSAQQSSSSSFIVDYFYFRFSETYLKGYTHTHVHVGVLASFDCFANEIVTLKMFFFLILMNSPS